MPSWPAVFANVPSSSSMIGELAKGYLLLSGKQNKKSSLQPAVFLVALEGSIFASLSGTACPKAALFLERVKQTAAENQVPAMPQAQFGNCPEFS